MIKARKNVFSLVVLLLAATLVFTACSGNNKTGGEATNKPEPTEAPDNKSGEATEAPKSELKPYTLKLLYTGGTQKDEAKVEAAISEYLTEKINAKLDIVAIDWGPWEEKTNLMIAGREEFDIMFTAAWQKHAINVKKGAFVDINAELKDFGITSLLDQYGQDVKESLNPQYWEGAKVGGINYAVPTDKEFAAQGGIVYRKDIAEKHGIDMSAVKTAADLDAVFKTIQEKEPGMTPLFLRRGEHFNTHYFVGYDPLGDGAIPGMILKDETSTKVQPMWENQRYLDNLKMTRDYFLKGYINKDAATTETGLADALKTGTVFAVVASMKPGKAMEFENQIGYQGKLAQVELTPKTTSTSEAAGSMLAISTTSKDPARAMMFINLLHSDKYLNNLLNFGIEGDHYEKVSNEIIKPAANAGSYAPGATWMFGSQFLNYVWETESPTKWDDFRTFNEGSILSPGFGFFFDPANVETEVAGISGLEREYQWALETGSVDIDKVLPEYIDKMKAGGVDKIIAEKQKQFDEFLASK